MHFQSNPRHSHDFPDFHHAMRACLLCGFRRVARPARRWPGIVAMSTGLFGKSSLNGAACCFPRRGACP